MISGLDIDGKTAPPPQHATPNELRAAVAMLKRAGYHVCTPGQVTPHLPTLEAAARLCLARAEKHRQKPRKTQLDEQLHNTIMRCHQSDAEAIRNLMQLSAFAGRE